MAEFWLVDTASWLVELLTNWLVTLHTFLFFSAKQKITCWLASLLIRWLLIGWIVDFTFVYFCSNNYCKYISLSLYIKMDLLWKLYFLWFYNLLYDFIHYFFLFSFVHISINENPFYSGNKTWYASVFFLNG